jgi:hypothetical protein
MLVLYGLVAAHAADWSAAIPAAEESRRLATEFKEDMTVARADTVISTIAGMRGNLNVAQRASKRAGATG